VAEKENYFSVGPGFDQSKIKIFYVIPIQEKSLIITKKVAIEN